MSPCTDGCCAMERCEVGRSRFDNHGTLVWFARSDVHQPDHSKLSVELQLRERTGSLRKRGTFMEASCCTLLGKMERGNEQTSFPGLHSGSDFRHIRGKPRSSSCKKTRVA